MEPLFRTELGTDGVLLATLDMPGRSMNVFSLELMDALDALMNRVDADPAVRSVVVTSGKSTFLAGADLVMVQGFCAAARTDTPEQMFELCGRLGRQFVRLEASAKPWVAAVNGLALGGGLELALACRRRLVADDRKLQLGVPEVRWGLLPGAGGTQRLPRLAGYEAATRLLLTGQSIPPQEAVALGIFDRAVPAAELLAAAREIARQLQGQAYDPAAKFPRLTQPDVPPASDEEARSFAARHGIDAETFARYPAYSAIMDSVLKGARLPLDQATSVEMRQFLRLMFNPVAGRMIATLFLERLRAEREWAAPTHVRIESIAHGPISEPRDAWRQALTRLKLPVAADAQLPADTLELQDTQGGRHRVAIRVLAEAPADLPPGTAVLAPEGPYGRVMELAGGDPAAAGAAAALAAQLRTLAWRSPGPASMLQRLRGLTLAQQADAARDCIARHPSLDPVLLDVAACLAGVSPAWSGGPLTWSATGAEA